MGDCLVDTGFLLLNRPLDLSVTDSLRDDTEALVTDSGLRGAMRVLPAAAGPMLDLARRFVGEGARAVRSILFDKTADSNWLVPWHQDVTIAVRERHDRSGWEPWSVKNGVPHVQPPTEILAAMLTLRLHLDDTPAENGALRVVPGSHRYGVLGADRSSELRERGGEVVCVANVGDVLLMRPMPLHASSKSTRPARRRVLHIDYAASDLPTPFAWAE